MKPFWRVSSLVGIIIGLIAAALMLGVPHMATAQAQAKTIKYGDIVDGEITAANDVVFYRFSGQQGDSITILMVRRSGNLRPEVAVADPSQTGNNAILTGGGPVGNGSIAGVANFKLPATRTYLILASRENVDKGTTTGQYRLMLIKGTGKGLPTAIPTEDVGNNGGDTGDNGDQSTPTATPRPTKAPTKRPSPTPTQDQSAEPTGTPEGDNGANTGEPVQSFAVGKQPIFSIWNGQNLFVSNFADGTVSMLDADGNSVKTVSLGGQPFAMAFDGSRVWVADVGTSDIPGTNVNLLDKTGRKVATYKIGKQPFSLSYDKDNKRMWIALFSENKVVAVDARGKVQLSVDTETNPNTVLWAGGKLWVTLSGTSDKPNNQVIAVDGDGNIIDTYKVGKSPADLAWNDADQVLYVANYDDNTISVLDADGKSVGTLKPGKQPGALSWDGTHLWVTLGGDKAVVALSNKGKVLAKFPTDAAANGVTFDGTYVWVANQGTNDAPGSTVQRIDVQAALSQQ